MAATATFTSKDNNWMEGTTTYWFSFEGETFGIVEDGPTSSVVDYEGYPLDTNEYMLIRVKRTCVVTDEMRAA